MEEYKIKLFEQQSIQEDFEYWIREREKAKKDILYFLYAKKFDDYVYDYGDISDTYCYAVMSKKLTKSKNQKEG